MKKFQDLYDFVDKAIRSRKYPDNTGATLKTALKLFDAELNEEERNSIDEFSKNIEQIYQGVFSKNKNFTASSLAVYKSRVLKVIADYKKYGVDATKMAGWSPKIVARSKKQFTISNEKRKNMDEESSLISHDSFQVYDFVGGIKLLIPKNQKVMKEITVNNALKEVYSELEKFSTKYFKEEKPEVNDNE